MKVWVVFRVHLGFAVIAVYSDRKKAEERAEAENAAIKHHIEGVQHYFMVYPEAMTIQ